MAELSKFSSYEAWIKNQMSLPIGSHREYYRARANPRGGIDAKELKVGSPRDKCSKGSRWVNFAFSNRDKGKKLTFSGNQIFVDGKLRTGIQPVKKVSTCTDTAPQQWQKRKQTCAKRKGLMRRFCVTADWKKQKFCAQTCFDAGFGYEGDDCGGGWQSMRAPLYLCQAYEHTGGKVQLSSKKDCKTLLPALNPAVWFSRPPKDAVTSLKFTAARTGVILLSENAGGCKFGDVIRSDTESAGQYYRHDVRLALLENTLENPHASPGNKGKTCSAVPKSYQNEKTCQLLPGCTPLSMQTAHIKLTKDALKKFHAQQKYVYVVRGIKSHENKVYDFTEWVQKHPGGKAHIKEFASKDYELQFTKWDEMERWEVYIGKYGETIDFADLPQPLQTQPLADAFGAIGKSGKLEVVCGSAGEVANDPTKGNAVAFFTIFGNQKNDPIRVWQDTIYDNPYNYGPPSESRGSVWLMNTIYGADQLRQRMAWALAQIFVVGVNVGGGHLTETWITYYDIFVRNAFGNFKDVLREVTYSPVMGNYLTFMKNTKLDYKGNFPDENYAREIMQLFSIGLWKLNADGSRMKDKDGNDVNTYSNDQIMNIARVFTGFDMQQFRSNLETSKGDPNGIDPMRMRSALHDPYPKPDLDGNYLGDGYPLCSRMPSNAFLIKGAKYVYVGDAYGGPDVFVASTDSPLFSALCGKTGGKCSFKYVVELSDTMKCQKDECDIDIVSIVKIKYGDSVGYYNFVPPTCVHLFLFNGRVQTVGSNHKRAWERMRRCANPDQLSAGISCCGGCTDKAPAFLTKRKQTCKDAGSKLKSWCPNWKKHKYCSKSCFEAGVGYDGDDCSGGKERQEKHICAYKQEKVRFGTASALCKKHGLEICKEITTDASADCGYDTGYVWLPETCSIQVTVDSEGSVSYNINDKAKKNKFAVRWNGAFPVVKNSCSNGCTVTGESCTCKVLVETKAVFTQVPGVAELKEKLKIGALPPLGPCKFNCKSEVKGYGENSVVDANTVFEYAGKFFSNTESIVHVGKDFSFRNPPVFMEYNNPRNRDAEAEVESFLEHLLKHPNTPLQIGRLLIQRLVTSNPSPQYLKDVAEAFKSGTYGGTKYSGEYGDLGATLAAILLNPEARQIDHTNKNNGRLREPLIKLVHVLRSMEYKDEKGRAVIMKNLLNDIGQWPYQPESVFNFYLPDYQPDSFAAKGLYAPEFQIFTPPAAMGFLNGMFSLISRGLNAHQGGFGLNRRGSDGKLTLKESNTVNETLTELDLLLTGGRLKSSMGLVVKTYEEAKAKNADGLKAAQKIILMSPEFNTLGDPRPAGTREPVVPKKVPPARDYKATIMMFFDGGADTFNMLVPQNCNLYKEYVEIRKNIALRPNEVQKIRTVGQACKEFGLHSKLDFVKKLYDKKKAAFVSNVGSLAEPITKHQWKRGGAKKCTGLFSHADMQVNAQTLHCQVAGRAPKGLGGRLADALADSSKKYRTTSFSVAGTKVWTQGFKTWPQIIDRRQGAVRLIEYANLKGAIDNITGTKHDNVYCEEYAKSLADSVESTEELGETLKHVKLKTAYEADTTKLGRGKLHEQFRQVARLIASREDRKAERDFFFVTTGGFDTHSKVTEILDAKFTEIDESLRVFITELEAQNVFDKTVIVSHSDFGRTLTPNGGEGTDHAYAGNHMILGGDLKGGRVFNKYPRSLLQGNEQDAGRGRLIPQYPWESMMVPIAEWMGLESAQSKHVFPNLGNFNSTHIIPNAQLFR
eukprot:gnl/MRDRNA2_/MRDRNA2_34029_c0_seq1.p1 gnl/MRDRNA2_/MRDRNA2_34029_c0~~gnl/MRDRNA2_/MRDRNA2_34029_c0_seq1.p1  ORF type:complete len:1786 (-),score=331.31 gnl/MRDRNA2_/MRDRNA2_34029_c0_seq1:135-5372(-)